MKKRIKISQELWNDWKSYIPRRQRGKNCDYYFVKSYRYPNIDDFLVENHVETHYDYDDENPPRHSKAGQPKYLQQTLISIIAFLLFLVMLYVGLGIKLLRLSWYKSMKPFRTNLKLVMEKNVCGIHDYFPGVDYSSNDFMLWTKGSFSQGSLGEGSLYQGS